MTEKTEEDSLDEGSSLDGKGILDEESSAYEDSYTGGVTSQAGKKRHAITEGPIAKQLLLFFFPILFGTFFQQLYNTSDAIIVGNFIGKEALSAVGGTTGTLINLIIGFFMGLSSGAAVVVSQYYGARMKDELQRAVHTGIALALTGGVILMFVGVGISHTALTLIGTPENIMPYSLIYIRIYFLGIVPNLLYNIGAGILRAIGDSKRPLIFLIISCGINIGLDILFVAGFRMGVFGASLATAISQLVSACMVMRTLMRTNEDYKVSIKKIKFDKMILLRIFKIGLPAGSQSAMYSISNVIIQANVNSFGIDTMAAWAAYGRIDGIFWMIMGAFGISITTFVGQNFGAMKYDRIKKGIKICLAMAMTTAVSVSIILSIFGKYVYRLFISDPVVIENGLTILQFLAPVFCTYVCIEIISGTLRGTGDAIIPTIMVCLGVCVFRIIWLTFAAPYWKSDIRAILICYPISWAITSGLFIIYYKKFSYINKIFKANKPLIK